MTHGRHGSWAPLIIGSIFVIVGVAYLLRNAGLIEVDWSVLWPLLLMAVGLLVLVGAFGGGGDWREDWRSGWRAERRSARRAERGWGARGTGDAQVAIPADGAGRLELSLRLGAGQYRLRGGGTNALVEATSPEPTIAHGEERMGDVARVRLSTAVEPWPWRWGWGGPISWDVMVASGVPTVLDVQAGAGDFDLDLSAVAVTSAAMSIGAGSLGVVLPRPTGDVPFRVEGGAASITFRVPTGVEARVTTSGLVTSSGPSETPGYAAATDRVTVAFTGGAASVRVVTGA